jgi:hypothetical protein
MQLLINSFLLKIRFADVKNFQNPFTTSPRTSNLSNLAYISKRCIKGSSAVILDPGVESFKFDNLFD